jgi:hypothetical protein
MKPLNWPCLAREFIHDRLYHPTQGYFCKTEHQLGQLPSALQYHDFAGVQSYLEALGKQYPEYAFLTPVEIFQPWYGYTLANYMLKHRSGPLKVLEIGGGTGTGALSILDFYYKHDRASYERIEYTVCEISPVIAETCLLRLSKAHPHLVKTGRVKVLNKSAFDWEDSSDKQVFVIALEVLDNLPHDRVYKDSSGRWAYQAQVQEQDGELVEVKTPISDPVIRSCVEILEKLPEKTAREQDEEHQEGFVYNLFKYFNSLKASDNIFLPTGLHLLFTRYSSLLPKAHFIFADFDSLLGSKLSGTNAPIVQFKEKESHAKVDYSTYLIPRGAGDIMFPTDFRYVQAMHKSFYKQQGRVTKTYRFMKDHAKLNWTETQTGYRPLYDDFKNTAIFTS